MAFATAEDVSARMGITFTSAQEDQAEFLLASATSAVADAAGKDDDWATDLSPVPAVVKAITVELVRRAMLNPGGLSQQSEQLGAYQRSESFRRDAGDLALTKTEERQIRRAIYGAGAGTGSPRLGAIIDECVVARAYDGVDDLSELDLVDCEGS